MNQYPPTAQYPPPPAPARSRPHRSYTKTIVIVTVAVLAGCLGLGGVSAALYKYFDSLTEPKPLASAVSDGPIYRRLPSACALPAPVVQDLVPDPEEANGFDRAERAERNEGARSHCHWEVSVAEGKRRAQTRALKVTATAYLDGQVTAAEQAKSLLDVHLEPARKNTGETGGGSTFGPVEPLEGVGQEAYAQDSVTRSGHTYGGTTIWARLDNLVLEISYSGSDDTRVRERAMPAEQARRGAETAARAFAELLGSCAECRS
ncbi:hypothetical protein [Phytohabitans kaempferiae]|uniref:DUF3558 domain-containing protein n=1 Tax=Phytohabitans kaempferiae TaxID=1620943 RepID=A0ABV6M5G1_9ACTN